MESSNSFDGQAGGCAHHILEKYFKGELTEFDLAPEFEKLYKEEVTLPCPYPNGDTKFPKILEYFENFSFDRDKYEILGVEKEVKFKIKNEYEFIGFIDLLYRNKETGEITLMDHKSSSIKFNKNGSVSKSDQEHWEAFKKQQLLYSYYVLQEYGRVDLLKWNMFKDGTEIEIEWSEKDMNDALDWAYNTIKSIEKETEYPPKADYYYCSNLCNRRMDYCPYKRLGMIHDGIRSKCYNPKNKDFAEYGGSMILMCDEWKDDKQQFFKWALDNGYNEDLILKRYDEYDGFYPENCYWDARPYSEEYGSLL